MKDILFKLIAAMSLIITNSLMHFKFVLAAALLMASNQA